MEWGKESRSDVEVERGTVELDLTGKREINGGVAE